MSLLAARYRVGVLRLVWSTKLPLERCLQGPKSLEEGEKWLWLACKDDGRRFNESVRACIFLRGDQLAGTNSTVQARISPQWLSELRPL